MLTRPHKGSFYIAPLMQCNAPSKRLYDLDTALTYAREASRLFGVSYAVVRVIGGRPRTLARIDRAA